MRQRGPLGARARLPAHRHRAGLRKRGERRRRAARERRPARRGVHHDQVPPAARRTRRPRSSEASSGWGSTASTSTSSTGRRAARPGPGREWSVLGARPRTLDRRLQLQRRTSSTAAERRRRIAPVVNQVQFSPYAYRRGLLDACERARRGARGLQPARDTAATSAARRPSRSASASGARRRRCSLRWCIERDVSAAREVDAPRPHRGEQPDLRLHAVRRRTWRRSMPSTRPAAPTRAQERKWW